MSKRTTTKDRKFSSSWNHSKAGGVRISTRLAWVAALALQCGMPGVSFSQQAPTTNAVPVTGVDQSELIRKLISRIDELENKVRAIEAGKVLPEISLTAEEGPSTKDLDQKLRILERKNELAAEAAEAKAKEAPRISVGQNGFALSSADTNFVLKLKGLVQLDTRTFIGDSPFLQGNDSFVLRRVRPILEGTVYRDFDYTLVTEFGGTSPSIVDAFVNYRHWPELQLKLGRFKTPLGLEQLLSDASLPFNERSLVSNLVPNRNLGFEIGGDIGDGLLGYSIGVFNGAGDNRNANNADSDDRKNIAARLFSNPFKHSSLSGLKGLGFGISGSYSQTSSNATALPGTTGGTLPGFTTDGQQQFFAYNPVIGTVVADGAHLRFSPQFTYQFGPFGLLGEYVVSHQVVRNSATQKSADLEHNAWQIAGQWVLTGEAATFSGISPLRPFSLTSGGWGAWQLVGRFGQLDVDDEAFQGFSNPLTSASGATSWSVGVNWWLNRNVRVMTSYSRTTFDGGGTVNPILDPTSVQPPGTVTSEDESLFFTRLQLSF